MSRVAPQGSSFLFYSTRRKLPTDCLLPYGSETFRRREKECFPSCKAPHRCRTIIALGVVSLALEKTIRFENMRGIGNQCYSKTSFTPHCKASRPPCLPVPLWLQGCDRNLSWGWLCGPKTNHPSQLAPKSNKPEGMGREI